MKSDIYYKLELLGFKPVDSHCISEFPEFCSSKDYIRIDESTARRPLIKEDEVSVTIINQSGVHFIGINTSNNFTIKF